MQHTRADADGWLILPVDLPLVLPDIPRRVAVAPGGHAVVRQFGLSGLQADDAGCVTDIDTVQDLQLLRSRSPY